MCIFSQYKDILGLPREGIHSIRVFDYAIIDIIMTFIGMCIVIASFPVWFCAIALVTIADRVKKEK